MTTCDILIIGGGIAGIGAGAMASPDASVVVLENEDAIGYHATGRSAAIFIMNYGNATLRALNAASIGMLENPGDLTETPLLAPRGELMFATESQLPLLDAYADGGMGLERLTGPEACALAPVLRPELVAAALYEPGARDIDADALLHGFARRLRRNGGRIETRAPAQAITHDGALWQVETPRGTFRAPILVNAAGGWADAIARLAGIAPAGLRPLRRSAAIVPLPEGMDPSRWPMFVDAAETFYAKPMAGKLMVSSAEEDLVEPHDAWADDMVIAEGLDRFERATTIPVTRVERPWAGLRTFATDRRPVVGFADDPRRFLWLAGQGGYGIQTSPALSQLAADLCVGRPSGLDPKILTSMAPGRFGAGGESS